MKLLVRTLASAALVAGMCVASPAEAEPASETPPAAAAAPGAPAGAIAAPVSPATEPPPAEASRRTAWPWILMGTGVALIVTAAVFQVKAVSEDDKREDDELKLTVLTQGDPGRPALVKSVEDHDDSAKTSRTISLAVGTVGFLAVAGSVILWFVEGGSSSPSPKPVPAGGLKPTFTPSLGPSYAGASLGASF